MRYLIAITLLFILLLSSCDSIVNPTARDAYKRSFPRKDTIYAAWHAQYLAAQTDSLQVGLPYIEHSSFRGADMPVYAYSLSLRAGEQLNIQTRADSVQVFIDVLSAENKVLVANKPHAQTLQYPVMKSGVYKIVVQPEFEAAGQLSIIVYSQPQFGFPVSAHGNSAIGSYWSDVRDGGRRQHEGIDIFAKRGTPVLAVTNGSIVDVGDRGLGGKQVWQRISSPAASIYYAHLDSIAVREGTTVRRGDTLGFVGNTGNAKTTPPHLHLGVYTGSGAIDPLPFVSSTKIPDLSDSPVAHPIAHAVVKVKKATLRLSPSETGPAAGFLSNKDSVYVLGRHKQWLHIKTRPGLRAFIHHSAIR